MVASCGDVKQQFLATHGGQGRYGYNGWVDTHWWAEVGQRLGPGGHYLDHTGGLVLQSGDAALMPSPRAIQAVPECKPSDMHVIDVDMLPGRPHRDMHCSKCTR